MVSRLDGAEEGPFSIRWRALSPYSNRKRSNRKKIVEIGRPVGGRGHFLVKKLTDIIYLKDGYLRGL